MAGIPVVASDFPDLGNVVKTYDLGIVCDPEDPISIADGIERVLNAKAPVLNEEKLNEFKTRFSWGTQQKILERIYLELGVLKAS